MRIPVPVRAGMAPLLLACACAAHATQADTPPPTRDLAPVVVTATRDPRDPLLVPASVDRIDIDAARRAQPRLDLPALLQRIPGVVARDRHNQAQDLQLSIRGFGARASFGVRGVRLYTDSIPATMPDGQGQVSHFALDSASRIEVLRGPFSALYGNASGGVVALFSAPPPAQAQATLAASAASDGATERTAWLRGPWPGGGYSMDATHGEDRGWRAHSRSRRDDAQASLRGELGDGTRITVLANRLSLDADDPQGLDAAALAIDRRAASGAALLFDTRKTVRQQQVGMHLEHGRADRQLAFTAWDGRRRTTQMLSVPVAAQASQLSGGGAIDLDRGYHGADLRWRWASRETDPTLAFTAGVQREVSVELRRGYENFVGDRLGLRGLLRRDERDRVVGTDEYAQLEWQPGARWRVDAGVRHSTVRFDSRDHFVTAGNPDDSGALAYAHTGPVAGVLFRATPSLSMYANAGSGFETPTFAELAYRADGDSGLNAALRPARSRNLEAGLRLRGDAREFSAALFRSSTRDELVASANQGGRSVFANASQSLRQGLELSASGPLASRWNYALAYTLLDARYTRDFMQCATTPCASADLRVPAGRRIPGVARQSAFAELRWQARDDLDVVLDGDFVGRVFANDLNNAAAPAYARLDLGVERRLRVGAIEWTASARIDNLFDRAIIGSVIVDDGNGRYFEPAPGRGWSVGLRARIGGN